MFGWRALRRADLIPAQALSASFGWPHRVEDWEFMLGLGRGWAAEQDGVLVGTGLCWMYGGARPGPGHDLRGWQTTRQRDRPFPAPHSSARVGGAAACCTPPMKGCRFMGRWASFRLAGSGSIRAPRSAAADAVTRRRTGASDGAERSGSVIGARPRGERHGPAGIDGRAAGSWNGSRAGRRRSGDGVRGPTSISGSGR